MSRAQQQRELERLIAVLHGSSGGGAELATTWVARLQALPEEGATLAVSLLRGYRHGALTPARWSLLTGGPEVDLSAIDEHMAKFWDAAAEAGLTRPTSVEPIRHERDATRRWAWQPRWYLSSQDEDLLLMSDEQIPWLLEIAATPRVPKRDYILSIVAHHARDTCAQAVYWERDVAATFARVAAWAPASRAAGASELTAYLKRLGGYARPGAVDRAAAVQRLVDVGRCTAPAPEDVKVVAVVGGWRGLLLHSAGDRAIRIDAETGAMTLAGRPTHG